MASDKRRPGVEGMPSDGGNSIGHPLDTKLVNGGQIGPLAERLGRNIFFSRRDSHGA
jgi:hypothetical protein